jgi:hemerythrin-like domain-containing protein
MKQNFLRRTYLVFILVILSEDMQLPSANSIKNSPPAEKQKNEINIPPTEDLMREHGLLNRVLLIYEEIIKQIDRGVFQKASLRKAVDIIKTFIEDYHEKLEEDYIFPLFEQRKIETQLVRTLRNQHRKGQEITARLEQILKMKNVLAPVIKSEIKRLLTKFIQMYRPHEAREDTILFPQVRSLISEKEFKELGERFEKLENDLFGEEGFEKNVKKVAAIEKTLGIYKLDTFTPTT